MNQHSYRFAIPGGPAGIQEFSALPLQGLKHSKNTETKRRDDSVQVRRRPPGSLEMKARWALK